MAKPSIDNIKPVALISNQRLTNRPGDSHLNQRLTRLGVRWPTMDHFRCLGESFRIACFMGLMGIGHDHQVNIINEL